MDEESSAVDQSGDQSDTEPVQVVQTIEAIDYNDRFDQLHTDLQVFGGICCVIVGLLLVEIILGTLRRFL